MKLVATDIDGTILPHGGEISPRTALAFAALADAGVPFVLVTARPPRWMPVVVEALGHAGEAIVANGAAVMDLATGDVAEQRTIEAQVVLEVAAALRLALPGVQLAVESARGLSVERGLRAASTDFPPFEVGDLESLGAVCANAVFKILARADGLGGADAMIAAVAPALVGLVEASHSAVDDSLLEFSPVGVSKASALEAFAARRGFSAPDVAAFGDAPNDIPMLAWAGVSYAMADGHPAARGVADREAPPASDDGVARVLEELFALEHAVAPTLRRAAADRGVASP